MIKCECGRYPELVKRWFKAQWRDECECGRCGPWMVRAHEYLVPDKTWRACPPPAPPKK